MTVPSVSEVFEFVEMELGSYFLTPENEANLTILHKVEEELGSQNRQGSGPKR
jgi:hypothetical protein